MIGYRQVLASPGMPLLLTVSLIARIAITADVAALTMYVLLGLNLSYAAAGGVAAALTAGLALGGPALGKTIDRRGSRAVLVLTTLTQAVFWLTVPAMPYPLLLGAAFAAGLLMVPVQVLTRQAITAATAASQRRAAFALESVQGEVSYMVGPAVAFAFAAIFSPTIVAWGVGALIVSGGVGLALLNPPLRGDAEVGAGGGGSTPRRQWLDRCMIAVLIMNFGTTLLLGGIDLSIVATLKEAGQMSWAATVVALFGAASVAGGLAYGAQPVAVATWLLLSLLALVTILVGFAHDWVWLCVALLGAGLLTAPTLTALTDAVSRLAPANARGEASGFQSAAHSAGFALGTPLVGLAIDASSPEVGFVVAGLAGLGAAIIGRLLSPVPSRP